MSTVRYAVESNVDPSEVSDFYRAQHHPAPTPIEKIRRMLESSHCLIGARDGDGKLIGFARGLTDGVRGYLVECKLDPRFQGAGAITRTDGRIEHDENGIAREMALRVIEALRGQGCERIDVLAYGTEEDFCAELGFKRTGGMVAMSLLAGQAVASAES
jgi:hypothetical protein